MVFQRVALALFLMAAIPIAAQSTRPEDVAVRALQEGDADKAASAFAEALAQSPRDPRLNFGAGIAAHLRGQDADARRFFTRALEIEPRFTAASALLGEIAYDQGDLDVAIRTYEQALKYAPTQRDMLARLKVWRDEAAKERRIDGPFSIAFEGPAEARLASHATAVLRAAYWRIAKALGAYPPDPIAVVLYSQKQFRDVTGAPEWADGGFDTRIRIPVRGALTEPRLFDRVLTHELVHAMVASLAPRGVPGWLHEGLATYLEPADVGGAERRWRASRTFVPLETLAGDFGRFNERQAQVAYDESVVAVSVLVGRVGRNMGLLLQQLDRGQDVAQALAQFGVTYADFEGDLAHRLR